MIGCGFSGQKGGVGEWNSSHDREKEQTKVHCRSLC
jgi:hypothetical protein